MQHPSALGTAQWADPNDIADRFKYNPNTDFFLGRNPYTFEQAIGVRDKSHVFLCSSTRGGKGRSIVINNLLQWRGSVISVDPKGENASICATRRADGDPFCTGLGQKTYVLDPYRLAKVPEALRGSCNPMDYLDANSGSLINECRALAEAMRLSMSGDSENWSKFAAELIGYVMAHVKTTPHLQDTARNLITVRKYIYSGLADVVEALRNDNRVEMLTAEKEGREPKLYPLPNAIDLLFDDMEDNDALRGNIAEGARRFRSLLKDGDRHGASLLETARGELSFLQDTAIEDQVFSHMAGARHFDLRDLKRDPSGVSVFICLPDNPNHPAIRWQKCLLTLFLDKMREDQSVPATGQQVLMCLDEFASMGEMPMIADGMNSAAGAGVKLFVIVTQLGDLEKLYDKAWPKIPAGCRTQIWFHNNDQKTLKYIQEDFGETQITLYGRGITEGTQETQQQTRSETRGISEGETVSHGSTTGQTDTSGTTYTTTHNLSLGESDSQSWNDTFTKGHSSTKGSNSGWSLSEGTSISHNWGWTKGKSNGSNREFRLLGPSVRSTNEGRNRGESGGGSRGHNTTRGSSGGTSKSRSINTSQAQSKGGSTGTSRQESHGTSEGYTQSTSHSSTLSETYAQTRSFQHSEGYTESIGGGTSKSVSVQESFQKRPLITTSEAKLYLAEQYEISQRDHPAYPGLALISFTGSDPFIVRKCFYDQDPLFEGLFTPHYAHARDFLPFSHQRLIGGQYTAAHFVPFRLPTALKDVECALEVTMHRQANDWVETGQPIFSWNGPTARANRNAINRAVVHMQSQTALRASEMSALLHKSWPERTSPFPGQTYPTGSVTGMPRAV